MDPLFIGRPVALPSSLMDRLERAAKLGGYTQVEVVQILLHHGLTAFERERVTAAAAANTDAAK